MMMSFTDHRVARSAPNIAAAICALSIAVAMCAVSAARGDECLNAATATAEPDYIPCDFDLPQIDLDAALSNQTAKPETSANTSTPWIAQREKGVPLTVNSSTSGVSLRTSLDDVRSFNTRTYAVDPSFSNAPALPKTSTQNLPIDIWTSVNANGYQGDRNRSTRTGAGVDYKFSGAATVGASVERGDTHSIGAAVEQDSKASAYVTLQATPLLSLDARTEWQAGNAEFAASNGAREKNSIIVAPKINHSFALGDGKSISPFLTYKRQFDVSDNPEIPDVPGQSAGAGVTYNDADAYTLSVTTDVDAATTTTPQSINSKFKLSVPIN